MTLLSIGSDSKTVKGEKLGVLTAISYMAPNTVASKRSVCPNATAGCIKSCLGTTSGRMPMPNVQAAMAKRTQSYFADKEKHIQQLIGEIQALVDKAKRKGMVPAVRLNGTSDIEWEKTQIMEWFKDVQFYDYSKFPPNQRLNLPANYHLTYSWSEKPEARFFSDGWARRGVNTAVVFRGGLPKTFLGRPVIDGDKSDLRFTDPQGVIVGLKAKGSARKDEPGFVVEVVDGKPLIDGKDMS